MPNRPPRDDSDDVRAIHQRPTQAQAPVDGDDVYVVDTRRRARPARRDEQPLAQTRALPVVGADEGPPPPAGPGGPAPRRGSPSAPRRTSPRVRRRRWFAVAALLLLAWVAFLAITPLHAWSTVSRVDATPTGDRPAAGDGHTYLLVGSDSRAGLSNAQKKRLGTGSTEGQRTDSIILVHVPGGGGKSVLVSIPRDSYVEIPGHKRKNKINAAYAEGGPKLLTATVERATGLRVDGYVEIGFGGFANVVDGLGGVDICVPFDMNDAKAHINLKKGCQSLDGANALGYVRARYSDPRGDIGRAQRQRQFLGAIMKKAVTPSTFILPWRYWATTHAGAEGLRVGEDTGLMDALRVVRTMRAVSDDSALSLVVPIADNNLSTHAGSAVKWDQKRAEKLFTMLREGTPIDAPPAGTDGKPTGG